MPITIKNVVLSYPKLFTPEAYAEGTPKKYSVECILPKDGPQIRAIKSEYDRVVKDALENKKLKSSQITPFVRPAGSNYGIVIDCDEDPEKYADPIYKNAYVCRLKTKNRPTVVDRHMQPIDEEDQEIYGGVIANVNLSIYAMTKEIKGVFSSLNGVQKKADGDAFGAAPQKVEDMFEAEEDDDFLS